MITDYVQAYANTGIQPHTGCRFRLSVY